MVDPVGRENTVVLSSAILLNTGSANICTYTLNIACTYFCEKKKVSPPLPDVQKSLALTTLKLYLLFPTLVGGVVLARSLGPD